MAPSNIAPVKSPGSALRRRRPAQQSIPEACCHRRRPAAGPISWSLQREQQPCAALRPPQGRSQGEKLLAFLRILDCVSRNKMHIWFGKCKLRRKRSCSDIRTAASLQGILGRLEDKKLNRSGSGSRNHQISVHTVYLPAMLNSTMSKLINS